MQQKEELKTWGRSNFQFLGKTGFQWHSEFCAFGLGIHQGRKLFLSYVESFAVIFDLAI